MTLIVGRGSIRLERCPLTDFRRTIDRVFAVSSRSTPLASQFSPTLGTGRFTQIRTPACQAGGRGFESRRSRHFSAELVQHTDHWENTAQLGLASPSLSNLSELSNPFHRSLVSNGIGSGVRHRSLLDCSSGSHQKFDCCQDPRGG
jgi:hypothetical protein